MVRFIREVSSDKDHILRHVVKEIKDAKGRRLEYQPDAARITLNKETGQVTWEAFSYTTEDEICREADRLFGIFLKHDKSQENNKILALASHDFNPKPRAH